MLEIRDGDYRDAAGFLTSMFLGMGDKIEMRLDLPNGRASLAHSRLRIVDGLSDLERKDLLTCWVELWLGTIHSHRTFKKADVVIVDDGLIWTIEDRLPAPG